VLGNELVLEPCHIHQGETPSGNIVRIWPTPTPGLWHMGCSGPAHATEDLVPADQIPVVLALWNVTVTRWTAHWKGPIHAENPDLEMVRRVARRNLVG
jgi:hypothetical protein